MKNNLTLKSLAETENLGSELANEILKKESDKAFASVKCVVSSLLDSRHTCKQRGCPSAVGLGSDGLI